MYEMSEEQQDQMDLAIEIARVETNMLRALKSWLDTGADLDASQYLELSASYLLLRRKEVEG